MSLIFLFAAAIAISDSKSETALRPRIRATRSCVHSWQNWTSRPEKVVTWIRSSTPNFSPGQYSLMIRILSSVWNSGFFELLTPMAMTTFPNIFRASSATALCPYVNGSYDPA